jgi:hypothetical protein
MKRTPEQMEFALYAGAILLTVLATIVLTELSRI